MNYYEDILKSEHMLQYFWKKEVPLSPAHEVLRSGSSLKKMKMSLPNRIIQNHHQLFIKLIEDGLGK